MGERPDTSFLAGAILPLDRFDVHDGQLTFRNLAVDYGFSQAPQYTWEWATFDN